MSDDVIVSNTPIFDRLAAERGYESLINDNPIGSPAGRQVPAQGLLTPGAWIAREVPSMEPEKIKFSENIDPEKAEDEHGSFHQYMDDVVNDFYRNHPGAKDATLTSVGELDGTFTITIEAVRPSSWINAAVALAAEHKDMTPDSYEVERTRYMAGVNLNQDAINQKFGVRLRKNAEALETPGFGDLISDFVKDATEEFRKEYPLAIITGLTPHGNEDGTIGMTIKAVEPEMGRHEVKDLAGQQLELYRQLSGWPKSSSYDDAFETSSIPKPLWISDSEIDDEE